MRLIIDLAIVAIVVLCAWRGWRGGLIRGVFGILALIVSLFSANLLASAYSGEFTGMLNPFIGGVVDTTFADMLEERIGLGPTITAYPSLSTDDENSFDAAVYALQRIGLPISAAENIARQSTYADEDSDESGGLLSESITNRLSSTFAYIAVFTIVFILLSILFAVIGNLVNLVFSIPGLNLLDTIAGAVFGLIKGLFIVFTLAAVIRYIGVLVPATFVEETVVLNYIVNTNPIARILSI